MKRRDALAAIAALGASACARGTGAPDAPTTRWRPSAETETILRHASFAPSRLNVQPWVVRIEAPRRFRLAVDPSRRLVSDASGREAVFALGAFVEALSVAASALSLDAEVTNRGSSALVELSPLRRPDGDLAPLVARCTVPTELGLSLEASLRLPDATLFVPRESPIAAHVRAATLDASMRQLAGREGDELATFLRTTDADARRTRDGHTLASLGIEGVGATFLQLVGPSAITAVAFRARARDRLADVLGACAGFLAVASDGTPAGTFDAGRRFLRLAVALRREDVALHPLAAPIEAGTLRPSDVGVNGQLELVARVGPVRPFPNPTTLRRPVTSFARSAA